MPTAKRQPNQKQNHRLKTNGANVAQPVKEVEFVLACYGAEDVFVCGDFNDWHPAGLRMIGMPGAGLWKKRLILPPGRHEYKFVVDGKWLHDPNARENVRNNCGSLNSVLEVQP